MVQAAGNECASSQEGALYARRRILEEKSNLVGMIVPDVRSDDPLPFALEVCEKVGAALGKEAAVSGGVSLPWTVAVQMRGMEQLIYDTFDDPDFIHAVMRFCTDYTKVLGAAVVDAIDERCTALVATEPSSGCSVTSPRI